MEMAFGIRSIYKDKTVQISIFLIVALGIFLFSSVPYEGSGGSPGISYIPIIYHILAFALFSFFLGNSLTDKKQTKTQVALVVAISLVYAILDEVHQIFVTGRHATTFDIMLDSAGIILGTSLYYILSKN